jgi:hypothetical protein
MGMALVLCEVSAGFRESERTVGIKDVNGNREFLRVPADFLSPHDGKFYVTVGVIGQDPKTKAVLVELPHEADSGAWRLWVWPGDFWGSFEGSRNDPVG